MKRRVVLWLAVVPSGALVGGGMLRLGIAVMGMSGLSLGESVAFIALMVIGTTLGFYIAIRYLLPIMNEYHRAFGERTLNLSVDGARRGAWLWGPVVGLAIVVAVLLPDVEWAVGGIVAGVLWRIVASFVAAIAMARSAS